MSTLRTFSENTPQQEFYKNQHQYQTVDFVRSQHIKYKKFDRLQMTMTDALKMLNEYIDPSDPDVDTPNLFHAYQSAQSIVRDDPDNFDLQITALIHDVGKILFKFGEPAWSIVGDSYPVGCQYSKHIAFYDTLKCNLDYNHPIYSTKNGIYNENCGIENLLMTYGHDEYLYQVLKYNSHKLPQINQNIIRFHSFYPWHTDKDYQHLMVDSDYQLLEQLQKFNKYDLYSKVDSFILTNDIVKYFDILLHEYFPDKLSW